MNTKLTDAHFVRTDDAVGLTRAKADEAIAKLQARNAVDNADLVHVETTLCAPAASSPERRGGAHHRAARGQSSSLESCFAATARRASSADAPSSAPSSSLSAGPRRRHRRARRGRDGRRLVGLNLKPPTVAVIHGRTLHRLALKGAQRRRDRRGLLALGVQRVQRRERLRTPPPNRHAERPSGAAPSSRLTCCDHARAARRRPRQFCSPLSADARSTSPSRTLLRIRLTISFSERRAASRPRRRPARIARRRIALAPHGVQRRHHRNSLARRAAAAARSTAS